MKRRVWLSCLVLITGIIVLSACGKADEKDTETENQNTTVTESEDVTTEDVQNTEIVEPESEENVSPYTFIDLDKTMYAKSEVNVRDLPNTEGNKLGELSWAQEVHVTGQCNETSWYRIEYNGSIAYVSNNYLVDTKPESSVSNTPNTPNTPSTSNTPNGTDELLREAEIQHGYICYGGDMVKYGQWYFCKRELGAMEADIARLAEGGLNEVIVDYTYRQGCGILVSSNDDATYQAAKEKLKAHVIALGYEPSEFGIGSLRGCLNSGVYLVSCDTYSIPYERPDDL